MKKQLFILCTLFLFSEITLAKQHTFGVGYGFGYSEMRKIEGIFKKNNRGIGQGNIFYNYKMTKNWSAELSHSNGRSDDLILVFQDIFSSFKLEYSTLVGSLKYSHSLSNRMALYSSVGIHRYDYNIVNYRKNIIKNDGVDFTASIGIEFAFANGFGFYGDYRYIRLGQKIKNGVFVSGVSYSF
jgi:hypothetical protein